MRPIDHFDTAAEIHGAKPALLDADGALISFTELRSLSERVAAALARIAVRDAPLRVATFSPNDYRLVICTLGIMRMGGVVVPVHAQAARERNVEFVSQARPHAVFYHSSLRPSVDAMRAAPGASALWICLDGRCGEDPSLAEFVESVGPYVDDWGDVYGNPNRPAFIRQTSGTSGAPKMVVGDIQSFDASQHINLQKLASDDRDPVCLVSAPFSHAAGVHAFSMLTLGATLVMMKEFDAAQLLESIPRYRVTHMWLPPTAVYLLLDRAELDPVDCSSLRSLVLGAAAVSAATLRRAVKVFGPCVSLYYAQIEGGCFTWLDAKTLAAAAAGPDARRLMSSGTSVFSGRLAVMGDDGGFLSPGTTGNIVVRGHAVKPYIVAPYEYDEREMRESRRFGWHHTGDVGYFDEDGFLYVVGRKKDIVNTAGFKISAAEVERVILELPQVVECAVVAVPDEARGEAVKVIVTARPGQPVSGREVLSHCVARLGRQLAHASVEQWAELPKSSVGKIDKQTIRAKFWLADDRSSGSAEAALASPGAPDRPVVKYMGCHEGGPIVATLVSFGSIDVARFGAEVETCAECGALVARGVVVHLQDDRDVDVLADSGHTYDLDADGRHLIGVHGCKRREPVAVQGAMVKTLAGQPR